VCLGLCQRFELPRAAAVRLMIHWSSKAQKQVVLVVELLTGPLALLSAAAVDGWSIVL
jgi:hypothetical protein